MILIAIDIVYRQMVLNDINSNRYCVQTNGCWIILMATIDAMNDINRQSISCTDKWYWMILIAIDIVYRQMVLNDINSNRYYVQTNGIEWY